MIRLLSRLLSVIIIIFFSLFILEGLGSEFNLADSFSHLFLVLIVAISTFVSWKWAKRGGWIFLALGLVSMIFFTPFLWIGLIIGGVISLTGLLFLLDGFKILK